MKTFGDVLELLGSLITAGGLVYAWHRLTGRFTQWRSAIAKVGSEIRARLSGPQTHTIEGATFGGFATLTATAEKSYPIDVTLPLERQVARLVEISQAQQVEINALERHIHSVRENPAVTMEDVEIAVAEAISKLESIQTGSAVRDLGWALLGIGLTVVGISVGIVA
ncbi:hypothetical protein ABZ412_34275 [Nocardia sp. NPDC005746]|uniref:hypothetical protein n=1 Tax=Nocardia sp. NPDC005746 TaxID=3157062 RepID=UPI0033CF21D9